MSEPPMACRTTNPIKIMTMMIVVRTDIRPDVECCLFKPFPVILTKNLSARHKPGDDDAECVELIGTCFSAAWSGLIQSGCGSNRSVQVCG